MKIAPTKLYSNGIFAYGFIKAINQLDEFCISRAHFDDQKNFEIMGARYDIKKIFKIKTKIKLSLL